MVQWTDPDVHVAKPNKLWLGKTAKAVYIQHAGLEQNPLHYNVVREVGKFRLGMQI